MIDIVGYCTRGYVTLVVNWLASLDRLGIGQHATVYCTTPETTHRLWTLCERYHWRTCLQHFPISRGPALYEQADWGTPQFSQLVIGRLELLKALCEREPFRPFIQVDLDCAFVRDPLPYLRQLMPVDIRVQSNLVGPGIPSDREYCNGIAYYQVPCPGVPQLATELLLDHSGPGYLDDEGALNEACRALAICRAPLAIDLFPTGRVSWQTDPMIVHANWCVGIPAKIAMLRRNGFWFAPEVEL